MTERFFGENALFDCEEVVARNPAVAGDKKVAKQLTKNASIELYSKGDVLITQGATDRDVYFLLSGEVDIQVNNQVKATRIPPISVGEMAAVDPDATRSATVVAKTENVVVARVKYREFNEICKRYPDFLNGMNRDIRNRFRERLGYRIADEKRLKLWPYFSAGCGLVAAVLSLAIFYFLSPELQLASVFAVWFGIVVASWIYFKHEKFFFTKLINVWVSVGAALFVFNFRAAGSGYNEKSGFSFLIENVSTNLQALVWVVALVVLCIANANHRKRFD